MNSNRLIFTGICIVFFACFAFSLLAGSTPLDLCATGLHSCFHSPSATILWALRLPRTLTALTCGGLLALAGMMMQLLLQNPLADPYILGVSSAAAFMTLLLLCLGFGEFAYQGGAWLGSLIAITLIVALSRQHHFKASTLLLTGVALASLFSAGISLLLLINQTATVQQMLFWLTGDLNTATYPWLGLFILVSSLLLCSQHARGFDVLLRGETEASALGLPLKHYRYFLFFTSALCTAMAVTLAGCLGFIGLIIPHLARRLVGWHHQKLIPAACLLGASLLMAADTLARTCLAPEQLPVGILLTFIGVPVFIGMLSAWQN